MKCPDCGKHMSGRHHKVCDNCWNKSQGIKLKKKNPKIFNIDKIN